MGGSSAPRLRVLNGVKEMPGVFKAEVVQNSYYHPDTFRCESAINYPGAGGIAWWSQQPRLVVTVQVGLDTPDGGTKWTTLITGEVDHVSVHPDHGIAVFEGRDLTASMVDARTQAAHQNLTASQIVRAIAASHDLTPVVTDTTTLVSRYYGDDHTQIVLNQFSRVSTEWGLITFLAQREGFDAYVSGRELHFEPRQEPNGKPYKVRWSRDDQGYSSSTVIDLRLDRALTLAGDITVTVRSYHSGQRRGFSKTARRTGSGRGNGTPQNYVYLFPNLTEDEALRRAQAILEDLSQHERIITFRQPGDLELTTRRIIRLSGTGSDWDQEFYPDSITRSISHDGGFVQDVRAKNVSPNSQVQVS